MREPKPDIEDLLVQNVDPTIGSLSLSPPVAFFYHTKKTNSKARPYALIFDDRPQIPPAEIKMCPQLQFKSHTIKPVSEIRPWTL